MFDGDYYNFLLLCFDKFQLILIQILYYFVHFIFVVKYMFILFLIMFLNNVSAVHRLVVVYVVQL